MPTKTRLDVYLVENGHASGREKAKELIASGAVQVNGKVASKASAAVGPDDNVCCEDAAFSYVGRGALKLEKALQLSGISPEDGVAMDVGASTGGFTQCLLRYGARMVYAVDVGHDQLHPLLRSDPRVVVLEGTDVRSQRLKELVAPGTVDLITMDVSFISIRQVLPFLFPYLKENGRLIVLIKPQFEAGKADVGKNGIVRDRRVHMRVLRELTEFFAAQACGVELLTGSPITGGAGRGRGNVEYLAVLSRNGTDLGQLPDIRSVVEETMASFSDKG